MMGCNGKRKRFGEIIKRLDFLVFSCTVGERNNISKFSTNRHCYVKCELPKEFGELMEVKEEEEWR